MKYWFITITFVAALIGTPSIHAQTLLSAPVQATTLRVKWPTFSKAKSGNLFETRALQQLLNFRGAKLKSDGKFGSQTEAAVKKFQRTKGLKVDGIVGPKTWERLITRLKRGDKNLAVDGIQNIFSYIAGESGNENYATKVDGVFGAKTEKAVRFFQKESGLKVDGVIGPQTWCLLLGGKVIKS